MNHPIPRPLPACRACWVCTVDNLDWPSKTSAQIQDDALRIETQKTELLGILDEIAATGMNTVVFQVMPCADAFHQSSILPWSAYLTGQLGKHPGFDPLEFIATQAHARRLKLHAWLNPYRVSLNTHPETILTLENTPAVAPQSVYTAHRAWIGTAHDRFVLDPGVPAVRAWLEAIIAEIIEKYDVDGIHFDDYFYYESNSSALSDDGTYASHGQEFANKADWRRNNTYQLIKDIAQKIEHTKPSVEFGISPSGVWRNKRDDPAGSDTQVNNPHYDHGYADTRRWVQESLIDYIVPQVYWPFARAVARYDVIARWWADTVQGTGVRLYIGMALYKVGTATSTEPDWAVDGGVAEIERQLNLNDATAGIDGCMLFRSAFLHAPQTRRAIYHLQAKWRVT